MRLTLQSSYLSINSFPEIELPDFCLLTGPNGAGKSHLLQALYAGRIRADCAPNQNPGNLTEIRIFDWNTLVPQDTPAFSSETLGAERNNDFNHYYNAIQQPGVLEPIRAAFRNLQLPDQYTARLLETRHINYEELKSFVGEEKAQGAQILIDQARQQSEQTLLAHMDERQKIVIQSVAETQKRSIFSLTHKDFSSAAIPAWGQSTIFQQSFARLFVAYRDLSLSNQLNEFAASKGKIDRNFLSDDEFSKKYGPAPWDFVNKTIEKSNLDFKISQPEEDSFAAFLPQLTKISSGVTIPFSGLSSGEKILMSLAFCVYYANDKRQPAAQPKLILFDEVDATLHPSMCRNFVETVRDTLVGSLGIKIIAATHSPSTVAMAPEESVYVMRPGMSGIYKTSRAEALNVLTVGVPTLSISFEGRRQVFVESPSDAETYGAIYQLLRAKIASERSLDFVATGTRSAAGNERNTGCDAVKRIVSDLGAAGNKSVFGLLDWDGSNIRSARIAVLAEGRRNGLENAVFDPLAICLLICRDCSDHKEKINIPRDTNYRSMSQLEKNMLQPIIDQMVKLVVGSDAIDKIEVEYVGGLRLDIDTRYLTLDDHELEKKLLATFPFLGSLARGSAGQFLRHVVKTVFTDVPESIAIELRNVFEDLLERPSH